jgi:hypothetical protein
MNSVCKQSKYVADIRYPILYYPFWVDTKNYGHPNATSGIVDASFQSPSIYWQNTIGYKTGVGSLYAALPSKTLFAKIPTTRCLASNGFTMAFRINITREGMLFADSSTRIFIHVPGVDSLTYNLAFGIYINASNDFFITLPELFSYNRWYHVVWVVNPLGASYAYINGGSANGGKNLTVSTTAIIPFDFTAGLYKTFFYDPYNSIDGGGATGYLNNFYYYGRAVTQSEITILFKQ